MILQRGRGAGRQGWNQVVLFPVSGALRESDLSTRESDPVSYCFMEATYPRRKMDGLLNKLASLGLCQTLFSALSVIQISFQIIQDGWGFVFIHKERERKQCKRMLGDFFAFTSSFWISTLSLIWQNTHYTAKRFSCSVFFVVFHYKYLNILKVRYIENQTIAWEKQM